MRRARRDASGYLSDWSDIVRLPVELVGLELSDPNILWLAPSRTPSNCVIFRL
jgi:hypothetical protein